mmetsp:Transcript_3443/g.6889  ORF Transcript_3443/g.6889 Transcript_3443/m.6889 type:complete len:83 (-) Transcript_3443:25-273(-)
MWDSCLHTSGPPSWSTSTLKELFLAFVVGSLGYIGVRRFGPLPSEHHFALSPFCFDPSFIGSEYACDASTILAHTILSCLPL